MINPGIKPDRPIDFRDLKIDMRRDLPTLDRVAAMLLPNARPERPSIEAYEASLDALNQLTPPVVEAIAKAKERVKKTRSIVYVAGPLTGVSEELKDRYGHVSSLLESYGADSNGKQFVFGYVPHLHGTDPIKHPSVTSEEVRNIDSLWASVVASLHVNFLSPTAHGNAIELGWAEPIMIPTIFMNPNGNRLSRLTTGMQNIVDRVDYDDFASDGLDKLGDIATRYVCWLRTFPDRDPREFHYRSPEFLRAPIYKAHGLDPKGVNLNFTVDQFWVYFGDKKDPYYGQAGRLVANDWNDSGALGVKMPDNSFQWVTSEQQAGITYFLGQ